MNPGNLDRLRHSLAALSDASIGSRAVAKGWISHAQFQECLKEQKARNHPLGEILVEKKFITREQLAELILVK